MQAKEYKVMEMCVENGVAYGIRRAYKHINNPSQEQIEKEIYQAVMTEICEWFDFNDTLA